MDIGALAQYGVLGIFSILLIVFARTSYRRETDRADRLEAENVKLNDFIRKEVVVVLSAATRALEDNATLLTSLVREREDFMSPPKRARREGP